VQNTILRYGLFYFEEWLIFLGNGISRLSFAIFAVEK
jgi:hypothetical protein